MEHFQEPGETLMAICAESPGCFEIDPEFGEPMGNCVYSELLQLGYSRTSSASSDEKDGSSINFITTWSTRTPTQGFSIKCTPSV